MTISLSGAVVLAISTYIRCAEADLCQPSNSFKENDDSKIELWMEHKDLITGVLPAQVLLDVPFTSQAPHHNWNVPYDEACEEASIIMVEYYFRGEELTPEKADREIKIMVDTETQLGWGIDISSRQAGKLAQRIYGRNWRVLTGQEVTLDSIKRYLAAGNPVIIPVAGRELNNPNFRGLGPPYHMIVLTGYDEHNFFAHDPGTQFGKNHKYTQLTIINAIHEWTGSKATVQEGEKAMLVMQKTSSASYVAAYGF